MSDDKTIRHPHDGKRIDINDPYEVKNWCAKFEVTENELRVAVNAVGTSAHDVWIYLLKI